MQFCFPPNHDALQFEYNLSRLIRLEEYEEYGWREEDLQKNGTSMLNFLYEYPPLILPN